MTITFDCTDVDEAGLARPPSTWTAPRGRSSCRREDNPTSTRSSTEYHGLTGIPTLINTSFNMHEEPIVCTPDDAVRGFLDGNLDYLSMGPFLVAAESLRAVA